MPRLPLTSLVVVVALSPLAGFAQGKPKDEFGPPVPPTEAAAKLNTPDDLVVEQVLAEPVVQQPLFLNFDERGRLWVVNYLQYPNPAGLKRLSRDKFWRSQYDKVPVAPPNHTRGADSISIHEDTDGDGTLDKHSVFVDGLSIVTSFARGRGGVWVLNPPYLLFYPDRDNDDVPDGDPEVHLSGFGIEDTHSNANCLRWGPDGWLYACQGSTVSGNIVRPGLDKTPTHSMGQLIWRYHPETKRYEIFAEGGGNAFGCEIDSKGRIYSGHNGGNTRGFHYVQGGYYQKGFNKHGQLSNPYTFGYFSWMTHHNVPRFTHNFVIYEGDAFPQQYDGRIFGVGPLQSHVVMADVDTEGSSFKTNDVGHPLTSDDKRFRPVEIKVGPDGAIYVADMYEQHISHRQHYDGQIEKDTGRVYRLKAKDAQPEPRFDLGAKTTAELVEVLRHENKWFRQEALRLIGDRKDQSLVSELKKQLADTTGQFALELFWAINLSGGFDNDMALEAFEHDDPYVRQWAVRLIGDDNEATETIAKRLAKLAKSEPHVHVRSQLASTARRLPAYQGLPIVRNLLSRDEDVGDIHLPLLLWWAIEAKAESDRAAVVEFFSDPDIRDYAMTQQHIMERIMRRYARSGKRRDLVTCGQLFDLAANEQQAKLLMAGFEKAFEGRSLSNLPDELVDALARHGGGSLALRLRQFDPDAIQEALKVVGNNQAAAEERTQLIDIIGEVKLKLSVPVLFEILRTEASPALQSSALTALRGFDDSSIGETVVALYSELTDPARETAQSLLASRPVWAQHWLNAIDDGAIDPKTVSLDNVWTLQAHREAAIQELVRKHWGDAQGATPSELKNRIEQLTQVIVKDAGDPYEGQKLFRSTCAKCHVLFTDGGKIGPDLTSFKRDDLSRMLLNIVNPSAEIREGFETWQVITDEGRTATGFLVDKDEQVVILRGSDGRNVTIPADSIDEMIKQPKSLMPEGLLKPLGDQAIRDLFAYLRSSQPLNN